MTMEHFPDVPEEEPNELLFINCLNLVLLLGAAFVTVGIGQYGLFGFATIEHVSAIYPTLVTAPQWAMLSTTFVMIVCLLIWATAQIFPAFRLKARDGIKHYFVGVALLQIVWVLTFAYQLILLSLFAAVAILIFVGLALHDQDKLQQEQTRSDYLVLKFPFVYLFGYEMYIALWTLCIVLVDASVSDTAQYWVALLALIIMTIASFGCMLCDDYTISCVQSYIMIGISVGLNNPGNELVLMFGENKIKAVQITSLVMACLVIAATVVYFLCACRQKKNQTTNNREQEDSDVLPNGF